MRTFFSLLTEVMLNRTNGSVGENFTLYTSDLSSCRSYYFLFHIENTHINPQSKSYFSTNCKLKLIALYVYMLMSFFHATNNAMTQLRENGGH